MHSHFLLLKYLGEVGEFPFWVISPSYTVSNSIVLRQIWKKTITWAYHTNILLVGTRSVTPARVRAFNKSGLAAITVHLIHPNTAASRPKTLKSLPYACETKFIANNMSVFFFPIVITNCSPFPLVEHLNTSFILRATTTQTNVAFGSSLCYNINTFFRWTSVIPQRTMYKINGFHDFWRVNNSCSSMKYFKKNSYVYKCKKKKKIEEEKIVLVNNKKLAIPEQVTPANP